MLFAAVAAPLATRAVRAMYVVGRSSDPRTKRSKSDQHSNLGLVTRLQSARTDDFTQPVYGFIYLGEGCADDASSGKSSALGQGRDDRRMLRGPRFLKVPIHKPSESVAKPDAAYPKNSSVCTATFMR